MNYQKTSNTNYFDSTSYSGIMSRLDKIQPNSERKWGKMTVSQMLHHLNLAIGSGLGYYNLPDESNFLSRNLFPVFALDVLKKFPIGLKTVPSLIALEEFDFETEKRILKEILAKAYATKTNEEWGKHAFLGQLSRKKWGQLIMIHCNHHFQQFSN